MNLKQMMADDLDIFYDASEFATAVKFNNSDINVLELDDIEVSSSEQKVVSAKSDDVVGIKSGDSFVIGQDNYKVTNFDFKDSTKSEMLIALVGV
jgi:hypothetical protein